MVRIVEFGRGQDHLVGSAPLQNIAPVAQRIEHLTTDQKVRGSNPFGRASSVGSSQWLLRQ